MHRQTARHGDTWTASTPVFTTGKPLWIYANVHYPLSKPVTGAGYYYGIYTARKYNLSSRMHIATPDQLQSAGVKATLPSSEIIEDFKPGWEKEWFTYKPEEMGLRTHKVYDDRWKAPKNARLFFTVRSARPNKMVIGIDGFAAAVKLAGGSEWETITLSAADFKDAHEGAMAGWDGIKEFRFLAAEHLRPARRGDKTRRLVGGNWKGNPPEFRILRWINAE